MKNTLFFHFLLGAAAVLPAAVAVEPAEKTAVEQAPAVEAVPAVPAFHADWTPEEQAALLAWRESLREYRDAYSFQDFNALVEQLLEEVDKVIAGGVKVMLAARWQLDPHLTMTPQGSAAFLGATDALKMMILRGADPNLGIWEDKEDGIVEVPLASVLAGVNPTGDYKTMDTAARLELAEWLLQHGAKLDAPGVKWWAFIALGAGFASADECHPEVVEWAADHGLPLGSPCLQAVLQHDGTLPALQRLVEKHPDFLTCGDSRPLNALLSRTPADMLAKAEYLIARGVPVTKPDEYGVSPHG